MALEARSGRTEHSEPRARFQRLTRLESAADSWLESRPWLDTPLLPAAVLLTLVVCFVVLRVLVAGDGDISTFVQAGRDFTNPAQVHHGLAVRSGPGYDGQ